MFLFSKITCVIAGHTLLQLVFVSASEVLYVAFVLSFFFLLVSSSFGASERLYFIIEAFSRYLHLCCCYCFLLDVHTKEFLNCQSAVTTL